VPFALLLIDNAMASVIALSICYYYLFSLA
jgi:hypothetical protein